MYAVPLSYITYLNFDVIAVESLNAFDPLKKMYFPFTRHNRGPWSKRVVPLKSFVENSPGEKIIIPHWNSVHRTICHNIFFILSLLFIFLFLFYQQQKIYKCQMKMMIFKKGSKTFCLKCVFSNNPKHLSRRPSHPFESPLPQVLIKPQPNFFGYMIDCPKKFSIIHFIACDKLLRSFFTVKG